MVRADEHDANTNENAAVCYEHIDWIVEIDWVARAFVRYLRVILDSVEEGIGRTYTDEFA
jgi:hypothetical protein